MKRNIYKTFLGGEIKLKIKHLQQLVHAVMIKLKHNKGERNIIAGFLKMPFRLKVSRFY